VPSAVLSKTEPFPLPAGTPPDIGPTLERIWPQGQTAIAALAPRTPHTWSPAATTTSRSTTRTWSPPPPNCC
jgi:hypothetical protein